MDTNESTDKIIVTLVYIGTDHDGKHVYREVDGEALGEYRVFGKKIGSYSYPGMMFEIQKISGDGFSVYSNTVNNVRPFPDEDKRAEWSAAHKANETLRDMQKNAMKVWMQEQLSPIRDAYHQQSTGRRKAAFLATVIEYLTR